MESEGLMETAVVAQERNRSGQTKMRPYIWKAEWKAMLVDALHALEHLDALRLEEMAISCAALVSDRKEAQCDSGRHSETRLDLENEEMAIFARVLAATRANLNVLSKLQGIRATRLEYSPARGHCLCVAEGEDGVN
jgi:hypothetical protein